MKHNILKSRRFKHGSLATIVTVAFIAAVILVNIIATILLDRFPLALDMTKTGAFQLSQDSISYVEKVEDEVNIYVMEDEEEFASGGQYFIQAQEIMKRYTQYNKKIKVHYINLDKNPDFVQNFDEQITNGDIVVENESNHRTKVLTVADLMNLEQDMYTGQPVIASSRAEQTMTSAIMYVTDKNPSSVAVLTGHSESDTSVYESLLKSNNYDVQSVSILTQELSADFDTAVIAAPTVDYSDEEIKKLDDFLNNDGKFGKNVVYFASAAQKKLPKLEAFLEEWGIRVEEGYLNDTDTSNLYMGFDGYVMQQYVDEVYATGLANPDQKVMLAASRPLTQVFEERDNRTTSILLTTADTAVVVPHNEDGSVDENWDASKADKGQYATAILGTRSAVTDTNDPVTSNVLVVGSDTAVSQALLTLSTVSNNSYFINAMNTLNNKEEQIQILSVGLGGDALGVTGNVVQVLVVIFCAAVPVIVLGIGLIVWVRRRHL